MKTKSSRTAIYILISLGIISAFIYYLINNAEKYQELLRISNADVFMLFFIALAFPIVNGIQNTHIYRGLGLDDFSYWDGFLITTASTLANQLPIPGGILSRGYYLKRKYNLTYTKFASSTFAIFFCSLAVNGLIGLAVLVYWKITTGNSLPIILLAAFAAMLVPILVFWIPLDRIRMPGKLQHWSRQAVEGWMMIGKNPDLLIKLTASQSVLVVLLSLRYLIAFRMLSQSVTLSQTLLFASASILTQLVSIAPGGLGVREAIVASVATVLGFDTGTSVVAVSLDRLVVTIVIALTGWISIMVLGKQISNTPTE